MPTSETWELYPSLGVIVLIAGFILGIVWRAWKEFSAWIDKQNTERAAERDKQRAWEADEDNIWDQRWQKFIEGQTATTSATILELAAAVSKMGDRISGVELAITRHDAQVESRLPRQTGQLRSNE